MFNEVVELLRVKCLVWELREDACVLGYRGEIIRLKVCSKYLLTINDADGERLLYWYGLTPHEVCEDIMKRLCRDI